MTKANTHYMGVRIPTALRLRLEAATDRSADPYAPTITQVAIRGIELALAERQTAAQP